MALRTHRYISLLLVIVLGPLQAWGRDILPGAGELFPGAVVEATIEHLWPTQTRVGYQEVDRKKRKLDKLSKDERRKYLRKNPIYVAVGPEGRLYVVDHHHLARAVYERGSNRVFVEVLENFSSMAPFEFWTTMKARGWTYLRDNVLGKTVTPEQLPERIEQMADDPFRSLAGMLRKAGGFVKSKDSFFIEFVWGEALRQHFTAKRYETRSFWRDKDVERALRFAQSDESAGLPGRVAGETCKRFAQ